MRRFLPFVLVFALGVAVGLVLKQPEQKRPAMPGAGGEISVYIPDGAGGHNSPRLIVRSVHTNTEQPGSLPPDVWQIVFLDYPAGDGPVRTVTYRAEKR